MGKSRLFRQKIGIRNASVIGKPLVAFFAAAAVLSVHDDDDTNRTAADIFTHQQKQDDPNVMKFN